MFLWLSNQVLLLFLAFLKETKPYKNCKTSESFFLSLHSYWEGLWCLFTWGPLQEAPSAWISVSYQMQRRTEQTSKANKVACWQANQVSNQHHPHSTPCLQSELIMTFDPATWGAHAPLANLLLRVIMVHRVLLGHFFCVVDDWLLLRFSAPCG